MENIRRIYWITAGIAAIYFLSGIFVSIIAGFEPVLVVAGVFSVIGVLAAFHGARSHSQGWWACGILVTGFMTPTPWGRCQRAAEVVCRPNRNPPGASPIERYALHGG